MRNVEIKLAAWHRLYKELGDAESRLAGAAARPSEGPDRSRLEAEVARLKLDCESAFESLHSMLEQRKATRNEHPLEIPA